MVEKFLLSVSNHFYCSDLSWQTNTNVLFIIIQTRIYIGNSHVKSLSFPNLNIRNGILKLKFGFVVLSGLTISEFYEWKNTAAYTYLNTLHISPFGILKQTKKSTILHLIFSKIKECWYDLSKITEGETKGGPAGWLPSTLNPGIIPFAFGSTGNRF